MPPIEFPSLSQEYGNKTHDFVENVTHFGSGLIILPLIALLQNIAIAKAFCKLNFLQDAYGLSRLCALAFKAEALTG